MKTSFWRRWWSPARAGKHGPPAWRGGQPLHVEQLEDRTFLSGTPQLLADVNPGSPYSYLPQMVVIGPTAYFAGNDGVHGNELWKTDGTAAGTVVVADSNPGAVPYPNNLTNVNGTLFFSAGVPSTEELWKSDGTTAGTVMVAEIGPGSSNAYLSQFTNVNGTLFFAARDPIPGTLELWKSDGTAAGTVMVKELDSGVVNAYLSGGTNVNGTLFFAANGELWKSDGTAAGTVSLTGAGSQPLYLTNVNGTLFFSASDGTHGWELWKSDGTAAGTTMVKDINPVGDYSSYPNNLTNVNGTLYFSANDGTHGRQLWKSDGTGAGTVMVAKIGPGGYSSNPSDLTNVGGELFFSADDYTHGAELWKSDGTAAGTTMVKDINPGTTTTWYYTGSYGTFTNNITTTGSNPSSLTDVNGTLYFAADDGTHGRELWTSDGTAAGTTMVQDLSPGSSWGTWYSTGPYGGTETATAYLPNSSYPSGLTNLNGTLLFAANDGVHGNELWELPAGPSLALSATSTTPTAGGSDTFTITALNADGTPDTTLTDTVSITATDGKASYPASVTLTNGTAQFNVTFETAGPQSVTAVDVQTPSDQGSESDIVVQPAAASSFTLSGFPSPATAGVAGSFTVTAYDQYGNVATDYSGTVHFTSSDPRAILPADATLSNGVGQFSATLETLGTNESITATDTQNSGLTATQSGIEVIPYAGISGPSAGYLDQTLTYTLGAGADPAGTVFTVNWGDGTSTQTIATTVAHTYTSSANYSISVTATAAGLTSNPATETVDVVPVSVTVAADPARAGAEMLVITDPGNLVLAGNSGGVSLTYDGIALGNVLPANNETFALVEAFCVGTFYDSINASNLSVSSVLVGGSGGCTLWGGSGRNLLIAGTGPATLYAGSAGDILIGGATSYDSDTLGDQAALAYLMAEWDSTDSYATRIKKLQNGGGLNGKYVLNSTTVFDNNVTDYLYGYSLAAGASLDWFFAHKGKTNSDPVYHLVSGETVTSI